VHALDGATWPLAAALAVFAVAALITVLGSMRLAMLGDVLADRLKIGEALFGAVIFGGVTSLSGIVMTGAAAHDGHAGLAYSNAIGGIAAQTAALPIADAFYRRANLEHAAASLPNLMFGLLLAAMLTIAVAASFSASWTVLGVHPASAVLVAAYLFGLKLVREVQGQPYWRAEQTTDTVEDKPSFGIPERSTRSLLVRFASIGVMVAVAGWGLAQAAEGLTSKTALSDTFVGALMMGVVNALPEAITSVAAVRRGALTLAVATIIGGNAFDALNLVVADIAYRPGSIYHAARPDQLFLSLISILMTTVMVMGLVRRERRGAAGIGWESVLLGAIYITAVLVISLQL
jgi:cation:H+ antiporter